MGMLASLVMLASQVPVLLLPILWLIPSYAPHILVPLTAFGLAERLFRAPQSLGRDTTSGNVSKSSLVIFAASVCVQLVCLGLHFIDEKPGDVAGLTRDTFVGSSWSQGALVAQLVGSAGWFASLYQLGHRFTRNLEITEEHALLRTGLYSRVRHPGYSSVLLIAPSTTLAITRNLVMAGLVTLCFLAVYRLRIRDEERMLYKHFGRDYLDYRASSGDVFPLLNIVAPSDAQLRAARDAESTTKSK